MALELDGYSLLKPLWESANGEVYLAVRERDDRQVVLKRYRHHDDSSAAFLRVQRERDVLGRVAGDGIPQLLEIIETSAAPVLVLEYVTGVHLAAWAASGPHPVQAYLEVAVQIARTLARVHAARLIHRDISPYNVVIDPDTLRVHLIDFGIAQPFGAQRELNRAGPAHNTAMTGTLKFMAPEQTGRMNRGIDARSDLYSLGATLYLALTGRPAFEFEDPLALIHAHMARMPDPPHQVAPWIPEPLSRIVLKLLRKEPNDRYQSADLLYRDLRACQDRLEGTGALEADFEPSSRDVPDHPVFRSSLHGRDGELARLHEAYTRVTQGQLQVLTLCGEPGLGKSELLDGLRPEILRTQGYLAVGKFDAYSERPFAGLTGALSALIDQLLLESDERMAELKNNLLSEVGGLLPAVVELMPELRFIVGDTELPPRLDAAKARARLALGLERLLRALGTLEHPLTLFLDDMQWSDPESRFLLANALPGCAQVPLLLITAYRTDAGGDQAQQAWNQDLLARGVEVAPITLKPLDVDATIQMLSEALQHPADEEMRGLADLVHRKTGGNPLHIRQFVEHIHASGLLRLDPSSDWTWNRAEIAAAQIPDGAVALMTAKLDRLEPEIRAVLEFAACLGNEFDLEMLRELSSWSQNELENALQTLTEVGILAPCRVGLCFVHDRLRETAQSRMGEAERTRLHYDTARLLIARTPEDQRAARALDILEHLNRGRSHLTEDLRPEAVQLNLLGGKQQLTAGAASSAYTHFSVGVDLLRESDWEGHRALAFELLLCAAESAMQSGQLDASLALLSELDRRSPTRYELAQIAVKRIQVYGVTRTPEATARYILEVLRQLGVRWPLSPPPWRAKLALRWVQRSVRSRKGATLLSPATHIDPEWLAPIMVVGQGGGTLARHNTFLTVLASCLVMRTYFRHGSIGRAPFTLSAYAYWIYLLQGDAKESRRLAEIAMAMTHQNPDPPHGARCIANLHSMLFPWLTRRLQALGPLENIAETLSEMGEVEYAYYARFQSTYYLALAGVPIQRAQQMFQSLMDSVRRAALGYPEPAACERAYRLLTTATSDEEIEAQSAADDTWSRKNPGWAQPFSQTLWLLVLCVHGRYDLAFKKSLPFQRLVELTPYIHIADHTFYRGLSAAALARNAAPRARRQFGRALRESARRLRGWARHGPDFVHMHTLLEAESARLKGKLELAAQLYGRAARRAQDQDFVHHAALAYERHAAMLNDARRYTQASDVLMRAVTHYRNWGAASKAAELEELAISARR